ncbi:transmembrane protein, putative (macronuclear) [Tetrahymena thermophila SB210]|uniref:Transmembrane protein, putative n=1 Tax=Tetrahymena thermophila (strain SB210) TaxID=312017 RepID=W7X3U3_TETTS|nr:transmembrane protein, putative [Tetrahymena thermophila SB210]EWS73985.1 transmembrane protein, putative [Tetrahymena thermophila SB210]|eukprot:XP_012653447.1 transmembrane protein, putative [Tetrahymena thermophila SB210]
MKYILVQVLFIVTITHIKFVEAISTNYVETFILPQYTYIEFLKSSVKLLESDYQPGEISAYLFLTKITGTSSQSQPNNKNIDSNKENEKQQIENLANQSIATPITYDLLLFYSSNCEQFKNYLKAMQNQQWLVTDFQNQCIDCSKCYENGTQVNLQNLSQSNQMICCLDCSVNDVVKINVLGTEDSVEFTSFDASASSPAVIIIDNTPFPTGVSTNLADIYFNSTYQISITPNETYFTATVVICIIFGGIFLIGAVVILSMWRQYKQAKVEEVTRNLVNPDDKFNTKKKQN